MNRQAPLQAPTFEGETEGEPGNIRSQQHPGIDSLKVEMDQPEPIARALDKRLLGRIAAVKNPGGRVCLVVARFEEPPKGERGEEGPQEEEQQNSELGGPKPCL